MKINIYGKEVKNILNLIENANIVHGSLQIKFLVKFVFERASCCSGMAKLASCLKNLKTLGLKAGLTKYLLSNDWLKVLYIFI